MPQTFAWASLTSAASEAAGAAADVEHAPAAEVAELDERRERLPPGGVGRAQRVVDPGAGAEVRDAVLAHASGAGSRAAAGPRPRRAPRGTRTGSPRSANGISIRSKSRGHDRVGEELACLLGDLAAEVAARDVRQGEQADACLLGGERGLGGRRVPRLAGPLPLVGAERRLVDEQVDAGRRLDDRGGRARVAGERERAPRPGRAERPGSG